MYQYFLAGFKDKNMVKKETGSKLLQAQECAIFQEELKEGDH